MKLDFPLPLEGRGKDYYSFRKTMKNAFQVTKTFLQGRVPGQLVVQYTDRCNAQCPQCGMRASNPYPRHTLGRKRTEKIIVAAANKGFAALSFTGGEPFLHLDDICQLSRFAARQGIKFIRTGTNGFTFLGAEKSDFSDRIKRLADQLAATPIRNIWVSIDSCEPQVHEKMRGLPGVMRGIERAVPIFAERGIFLSANLGINRNFAGRATQDELSYADFRSGFERFYRYVAELGFTIANVCYPMWSGPEQQDKDAVYAATTSDQITYFSQAEKLALFRALFEVIPEHRQNIRIFTPRASLHALLNQYQGQPQLSSPCRGGQDFFFVDSRNGHSFPCGYRGEENLGPFEEMAMAACDLGAECRRCDWECFRDPSELFAPLTLLRQSPLRLWQRWRQDPTFFRLWWQDLRYYRDCQYFDGRQAPSLNRLQVWQPAAEPQQLFSTG
jgi:sulfatase maturation enzyme AslB (radical SAM superfamily)